MNEHEFSAKAQRYLNRLIQDGKPIWQFKVHGGPMQRVGVPDRLLCVAGHFVAIEEKSPLVYTNGVGEPTPAQANEMKRILDAGGSVACLASMDTLDAFVQSCLADAGERPFQWRPQQH